MMTEIFASFCAFTLKKRDMRHCWRTTAIDKFNHAENADGSDLPWEYYKRVTLEEEKEETDA